MAEDWNEREKRMLEEYREDFKSMMRVVKWMDKKNTIREYYESLDLLPFDSDLSCCVLRKRLAIFALETGVDESYFNKVNDENENEN